MPTPKARLLQHAAALLGREKLAQGLNVPLDTLDYWLRGLAEMPDRKLLPLADLIEELVNEENDHPDGTRAA